MKITVAILNNNINSLKGFILKIFTAIFFIAIIIAFCFSIKYIKVSPNILNFASNIRQAEKNDMTISSIISYSYPIFNSKNYIFIANKKNNDTQVVRQDDDKELLNKLDEMVSEDKINSVQVVAKNDQKNLNITDTDNLQKISIYNVNILNYSNERSLDFDSLFSRVITLTKTSDSILLYNTHTSESYSNSDRYKFEYDGTYRSRNSEYNMLKITEQMKEYLSEKSFNVKHDTTPHDYGTYNSSYSNSRKTVKSDLIEMGNVGLSIDVHRDAAGDLTYGPTVEINGVTVAQCMIVLGVGTDTLSNPYWQDNLSFALQFQKLANSYYPGLFKPMLVRNSVYNQDLNKFSILIEIGATGNTIDQALLSTKCLTNVLNLMYKN